MTTSSIWILLPWVAACGGGDDAETQAETASIEPCDVVTEADATALFEEPAVRDQGTLVTDPAYLGDCIWTYEPPDVLGSQNVAFYLWQGDDYYEPRKEAEPFEIGSEGSIYESASTGVDVEWIQDGKSAMLNYFTVGEGVPDALTKVDEVKALALKASDRL